MNSGKGITQVLRLLFGIFMIVVYLGMAYLMAVNFFEWDNTPVWRTLRWAMAAVFAAYGCYRFYRQITGIDYYRTREELENDGIDTTAEPTEKNSNQ
ncbi:MAG: hypothetical protein IJT30_11435 [Muribaculaceae bacterium]|nr:hypothetical protein [Muribaculaceae bacterium]